jgi:HAD superfamily hydrolase (TIGR01509 family)
MTLPSRPLRLVIFDCDGVLVDSEPIASRVLAEMLTGAGYPLTAAEAVQRFTGISLKSVTTAVEADWGRPLPGDFLARLRARDAEAFRAELRPVAGVPAMLRRLTTAKCVASSGTLAKMRCTLGVTGLLPSFEPHLFSAEMVERGKPAPDLFLYAAAAMGVDPAEAVVVEDAVAGITAAVAAGMRPIGFVGGGHVGADHAERLRAAGATLVVSAMTALPDALDAFAG